MQIDQRPALAQLEERETVTHRNLDVLGSIPRGGTFFCNYSKLLFWSLDVAFSLDRTISLIAWEETSFRWFKALLLLESNNK